ncbi:MAG: hypothetical protein ACAH80_08675 [Alphaproteobacteria bacterium]
MTTPTEEEKQRALLWMQQSNLSSHHPDFKHPLDIPEDVEATIMAALTPQPPAAPLPINGTISPWMPEKNPITIATVGKLGEEAAELAQRCFRTLIQGLDEIDPDSGRTNRGELEREIADVLACIHVAYTNAMVDLDNNIERHDAKVTGFHRWHQMIRDIIAKGGA